MQVLHELIMSSVLGLCHAFILRESIENGCTNFLAKLGTIFSEAKEEMNVPRMVACALSKFLYFKGTSKANSNEDQFQKSTEIIYIYDNQLRVYSLLSYVFLQSHLDS